MDAYSYPNPLIDKNYNVEIFQYLIEFPCLANSKSSEFDFQRSCRLSCFAYGLPVKLITNNFPAVVSLEKKNTFTQENNSNLNIFKSLKTQLHTTRVNLQSYLSSHIY